jgi:hypothetical protein
LVARVLVRVAAEAPAERTLVQLKDADGATWELSLPPDLVAVDRFALGARVPSAK